MALRTRVTVVGGKDLLGDLCAPVGTLAWCVGMRGEIQKLLDAHRTDHEGLAVCIESFQEAGGWKALVDARGLPFASYAEFCKTRRPLGLGCDPGHIDALVGEGRKRTAPDLAADPGVKPLAGHGGGRKQGANSTLIRGSTDASYLVRRLKRDHPGVAEKLARGEYPSARAAGIAAGIVRVPTAPEVARKAFGKMTRSQRREFRRWLGGQED
jgi:hypothetical protein